jgi:signal transduction histidine kinase
MLHDFLKTHRSELIDRCRAKVLRRRAPRATPAELEFGVPLFLDQLTQMLSQAGESASNTLGNAAADEAQLETDAAKHGSELLQHDFTIDQVVHDYGDLCQAITELAAERDAPITVHEFGTLNIKLDNAIAGAVTEYARQQAMLNADAGELATSERLGMLAQEMRNLLNTSILAISAIKGGNVGFGGATAAALDRSLIGMRGVIDRTLAQVRLEADWKSSQNVFEVAPFIADVQVAAVLDAGQRECELTVTPVASGIFVEADRHILGAAVANLLQNACKFTRPGGHVLLRAYGAKERVLIEVEDECGGAAEGVAARLSRPFAQDGSGLGLLITRRGVEASGGTVSARNASAGCVVTIDLPQKQWTDRRSTASGA